MGCGGAEVRLGAGRPLRRLSDRDFPKSFRAEAGLLLKPGAG